MLTLILELEFVAVVKRRWLIIVNILGLLEKSSDIENVIALIRFAGSFWALAFGATLITCVVVIADTTV